MEYTTTPELTASELETIVESLSTSYNSLKEAKEFHTWEQEEKILTTLKSLGREDKVIELTIY